jgi:hypothetical protein
VREARHIVYEYLSDHLAFNVFLCLLHLSELDCTVVFSGG